LFVLGGRCITVLLSSQGVFPCDATGLFLGGRYSVVLSLGMFPADATSLVLGGRCIALLLSSLAVFAEGAACLFLCGRGIGMLLSSLAASAGAPLVLFCADDVWPYYFLHESRFLGMSSAGTSAGEISLRFFRRGSRFQ